MLPAAQADSIECETLPACPLCGSPRAREWIEGFDRLHRVDSRRFSYRRCEECGVVYLSPRPTAATMRAFYPASYGPYKPAEAAGAARAGDPTRSWRRSPPWLRKVGLPALSAVNRVAAALLRDRVEARLRSFYEPWRQDLALLDFGCGSEKFLDQARRRGWGRTIGVDSSEEVVERVRRAGYAAFPSGPPAWEAIAPGSVHLVRLNHVLEHLYEPRETLARLVERLAPDGRLHLALPNPESFSARVFGSRWFSLDCPRHVMLFTPGRARAMVEEHGLEHVATLHETLTKDIARSLGYVWVDRGELEPEAVESLMHDRLLAELAWLPARVAALLRRADRFHLLARRGGGPTP
jgi:2-polyprenyl-3-methyl-5-hydroxy-6-metoxy-1,4-benzoquinol methylase